MSTLSQPLTLNPRNSGLQSPPIGAGKGPQLCLWSFTWDVCSEIVTWIEQACYKHCSAVTNLLLTWLLTHFHLMPHSIAVLFLYAEAWFFPKPAFLGHWLPLLVSPFVLFGTRVNFTPHPGEENPLPVAWPPVMLKEGIGKSALVSACGQWNPEPFLVG